MERLQITRVPHLRLALAASLFALLGAGCGGGEGCDEFATHLADVLAKENGTVPAEVREKMIKKTTESCSASPPPKESLDCAMKASTSAQMRACEAAPEAEPG